MTVIWNLLSNKALKLAERDFAVIAPFRHQACSVDDEAASLTHRSGDCPAQVPQGASVEETRRHSCRERRGLPGMSSRHRVPPHALQGQEAKITIITTVVTKPHTDRHIGFMGHAQKFNVAVSRAQVRLPCVLASTVMLHEALSIVIGNPNTLRHDPYWGRFLEACRVAGTYRGVEYMDTSTSCDWPVPY